MLAAQDIFAYHFCDEADSSGKRPPTLSVHPLLSFFLLHLDHCNKRLRRQSATRHSSFPRSCIRHRIQKLTTSCADAVFHISQQLLTSEICYELLSPRRIGRKLCLSALHRLFRHAQPAFNRPSTTARTAYRIKMPIPFIEGKCREVFLPSWIFSLAKRNPYGFSPAGRNLPAEYNLSQ